MALFSSLFAVVSLVVGVAFAQDCNCYKEENCADVSWAHFHEETGVYWTYASPCAGACSQLPDPLPYGWRFATPAEWALHPDVYHFAYDDSMGSVVRDPPVCSAHIFDPRYNHCDIFDFKAGYVTSVPRNTNWETLLVHDCDEVHTTPSPTCKDPCTPEMCEDAASGQRECSASGIEVDAFNCGGILCNKVKCKDCGTFDDCVLQCKDYKERKGISGPPNCRTQCASIDGEDAEWICLQPCQFGDVPICREMCSKPFCNEKGDDQLCSAQEMLIDPLNQADACQTVRCGNCGAQGNCVSLCEAHNDENDDDLNCAVECKAINGFKCFPDYTGSRR